MHSVFPLLAATSLGLASSHNYLAIPITVVTCFKLGFPEVRSAVSFHLYTWCAHFFTLWLKIFFIDQSRSSCSTTWHCMKRVIPWGRELLISSLEWVPLFITRLQCCILRCLVRWSYSYLSFWHSLRTLNSPIPPVLWIPFFVSNPRVAD